MLKYAQIVLAQHHKLLFWTKITFYKQVYLPLLLNQEPKPKFGCGCLPFSSISAHLSLRPLLLASLNIYKQVWICEKLWLSTDGRKFQWNDSGFVQTTRQSEQIKQQRLWTRLGLPGLSVTWNRSSFTRCLLKLFRDSVSPMLWVLTYSNVSFQDNFWVVFGLRSLVKID